MNWWDNMNNSLTILVDMDDVMVDLIGAWVDWLNIKHDLDVDESSVTNWDMTKVFPMLTEEEIHAPLFIDEFWMGVKPISGASDVLQSLIKDGHKIYVVTASHPDTMKPKSRILFEHFPFLTYKNIIVAYDKGMVQGDVIIDDYVPNLISVGSERSMRILITKPHNTYYQDDGSIIRASDWNEVYSLVYDLNDSCNNCGNRGIFPGSICPKCGSTSIKFGYGKFTNILFK